LFICFAPFSIPPAGIIIDVDEMTSTLHRQLTDFKEQKRKPTAWHWRTAPAQQKDAGDQPVFVDRFGNDQPAPIKSREKRLGRIEKIEAPR